MDRQADNGDGQTDKQHTYSRSTAHTCEADTETDGDMLLKEHSTAFHVEITAILIITCNYKTQKSFPY